MNTLRVALLLAVLVGGGLFTQLPPAFAGPPTPGVCQDGVLPSGALSRICIPTAGWNGDLLVWAHGYVAYNDPIDFYNLTFDGVYLPDLVQHLGFAFATTSYRMNGLAVLPAIDDVRELIAAFPPVARQMPTRTYMTGASEGGLVTTLLVERYPELFSGGLALCGPIGSFQREIDYIADFRVLFDYFFPGVLPASPIAIPQDVIDNWDAVYVPAIENALAAAPDAAQQLIRTSGAAVDPADGTTVTSTTIDILWYNVFGANDASLKLGGNPYGNQGRIYRGSSDDLQLNRSVQRFAADQAALVNLPPYETSGHITIPLVTEHTTGDEIIPFAQELMYNAKARPSGSGRLTTLPVPRYDHCNFTVNDVLGAFALLVVQVLHH